MDKDYLAAAAPGNRFSGQLAADHSEPSPISIVNFKRSHVLTY